MGVQKQKYDAVQVPKIMNTRPIHPCHVIIAVITKPFPIEQPPARLAPTPIKLPPTKLLIPVFTSGILKRNSLLALAAINDPAKIPSTKNTPQLMKPESPVVKYCRILADGVVIPKPNTRPVAALNGQAIKAITPINVAVTKGCQRFQIKYGLTLYVLVLMMELQLLVLLIV